MTRRINSKSIIIFIHGIITLIYIFTNLLLLRQIVLIVAILEMFISAGIMALAYFRKDNSYLIKKYLGCWIFFLPVCAITKIYGFSFLESQSLVFCLAACFSGIVTILSYRVKFHGNLIEGIMIFAILCLGITGITFDANAAFDSHKASNVEQSIVDKHQNDSGRSPEFLPFLFLTVNLDDYGEMEISVSKKTYENHEINDVVTVFICQGAFHMKYAYIDEIPAAPIYRTLDYSD